MEVDVQDCTCLAELALLTCLADSAAWYCGGTCAAVRQDREIPVRYGGPYCQSGISNDGTYAITGDDGTKHLAARHLRAIQAPRNLTDAPVPSTGVRSPRPGPGR